MVSPPYPGSTVDLGEVTTHDSMRPVIGDNGVAVTRLDRPDERASQHDLAGVDAAAKSSQPVGQPDDAARRMIEHAGAEPGLLDNLVARNDGAHPAQID